MVLYSLPLAIEGIVRRAMELATCAFPSFPAGLACRSAESAYRGSADAAEAEHRCFGRWIGFNGEQIEDYELGVW